MVLPALVFANNVNHYFQDGQTRVQVLKNVDLIVKAGEFLILTGPSGSGKSTLLSLLGCLRTVRHGSLKLFGQELNGITTRRRTDLRRRIGFITQSSNLLEFLTAQQNVQMTLELQPELSARERYNQSVEILDYVGLSDKINSFPQDLSGGQKQRVAIASALVSCPQLILADEPTAALDKDSGQQVVALMKQLAKEKNSAVILVTHDNRILDFADRIIRLDDGQLRKNYHQPESMDSSLILPKEKMANSWSRASQSIC